MRADLVALSSRLLSLGGTRVVGDDYFLEAEFEPVVVDLLLTAGLVFEGAGARLVVGRPSRCHDNAQDYAERHPAAIWWTGLGLSPDGAWRSHSWVTTGHGAVIETTEARVRYLGIPAAFDPSFDEAFNSADRARIKRRWRAMPQ